MSKQIKVLIVEDSEDDVQLLLRELKKGGYKSTHLRVETATAMKKALKEHWDIILSDYRMPKFSGPEALKVLQASKFDIPFIIVSGSVGEDAAVETLKEGAHDFITKMNLARLVPAIEREMQDCKIRQAKKNAEKALEESEHRYKHLFQNHPSPMWVYDIATLKFIDVNNAAIEKYGYTREEFLSMTLYDIRPKEEYSRLRENLAKPRPAHQHSGERRHKLKNGDIIFVEISSYLFEENGKKMSLVSVNDITERRAAESKVKESEQRYQTLAQISPVGIFRTDAKGYTTYVNPRWCQISGLSSDEALGDGWLKAVHPDDREKINKGWRDATKGRRESHTEYRFVRPDGTIAWVMGQAAPEKNVKNQTVGYVGTITDITERKKNEQALKESEDKFRNLVENINDVFYSSDGQGRFIYCSPNFYTSMGYSPQEIIGNSYIRVVAPIDRRKVVDHYLEETKNGVLDTKLEFRVRCKDGKIFWVEQITRIVRNTYGNVVEYRNVVRDITERKRADDDLRKSEEIFRLLAENATDIVWILDLKSQNFTYFSPSIEKIRGYTPEEALTLSLEKTLTPDSYKMAMLALDEELTLDSMVGTDPNQIRSFEFQEFCKDGSIIFTETKVKFLRDANGIPNFLQGITRDITERKRAENELKYREEWERLLTSISNRFVNLQIEDIPLEINRALKEIGKFTDVDRSYIFQFYDDGKILNNTFEWCNEGVEPQKDNLQGLPSHIFPWWIEKLNNRENIITSRVADLPPEAKAEKDILQAQDIKSIIVLPMVFANSLIGFIGFDCTKKERTWSEDIINMLGIIGDTFAGILERKRAEEALHESEKRFRFLSENSNDIIFRLRRKPTLQFEYVSPVVTHISGYTPEEHYADPMIGMKLIHPDDHHYFEDSIKTNEFLYKATVRWIKKDGTIIWTEHNNVPIYDENGELIAIEGIIRDISERKRAEETLKESEERFRRLYEESTDPILLLNEKYFFDCNPATVFALQGKSKDEIVFKTPWELSPEFQPDGKLSSVKALEMMSIAKQKRFHRFDWVHSKKDGSDFYVEVMLTQIVLEGEKVFHVIWRDITDRKKAEEQLKISGQILRESEERYRLLFDRMMDGVYRSTHEGRFVEINLAMVQMFGYSSREEMLNVDIKKELYFAPSERDSLFLDTGQERTEIFRMRHKNGSEIWVEDHGSYVHDETGNVIFHEGILRDVTQRLLAEAELKKSEEKYRDIFTWAPVGIYQVSFDGKFITINKSLADMLGYDDVDDLLERKFETDIYYNKEERQRLLAEFKEGSKDSVTNFEILWKKKDGSPIWVMLTSHAVKNPENKTIYYEGFVTDITERKRAEEELRKKEDRMRLLVEGTPYLFFYTQDTKGRITYISPSVEKITGRPVGDWYNQTHWFVTDNDINEHAKARTHAHLRGEFTKGSMLLEIEHADKHPLLLEIFESPMILDGKVVGTQGIAHDITERKKSELALQESERKLTTLVGNLPGMAYRCLNDRDWTMKFVSQGCYELTGYNHDDLLENKNITFNDLINENDRERLWIKWQEVLKNHEIFKDEYIIKTSGGHKKWVWEQGCGVYSDSGEVLAIEGIIIDITERKLAEEAMLKLSKAVESSGEVIFMTDPNGIFTYVNPEFTKLYGYEPDEVIGNTTPRILKSDTMKLEDYNVLWDSLLNKQIVKREMANKSKNGNLIDVEVAINPVTDEKQNIIGFLAIQKDITERKKAEEALKLQTTYFSQLFENSPTGIAFLDTNECVVKVNKAFEKIFQYSLEEIKGKTLTNLIVPQEFIKESHSFTTRAIRGELVRIQSVRKRRDSTLLDMIITGYPITIEGKCVGIYSIFADVSDMKKLEEQIRQTQKLESIGTLAGGIAHDFNNILGIILGYTSLLESGIANTDKMKQSVDAITRAVNRGAGLVKQILTFARKTNVIVEPVDVNASIEELVKMMNETFPKTITFSLDLEENLTPIIADHNQIHQALLNLSVNARDAILSHTAKSSVGTITFATKKITGSELRKNIPEAIDENYVRISVSDTGSGMDETTLNRIFEPFFTTKEQGKGTGLGLSVVYGVVKSNRGYVDVESEKGEGTTFKLYFPIEGDEIVPEKVKEETQMQVVRGSETILFVEDEEMLQEVVRTQLTNIGYRVLSALNGEQAVEMYRKHQNEIAVVLSDLGLPKLGGFEAFLQMKKINPSARVILASGFFDPSQKSAMLDAGVKYFVQKPYKASEIINTIRK